jgi:NitT/TauT family transport system substrate-binding protein
MRLTPLAKAFIALVILGVVGYTGWHYYGSKLAKSGGGGGGDPPKTGGDPGKRDPSETPAKPAARKNPNRIVVGVNDFGGAYPGVVANDGAEPGPKSRFTAGGVDVEFRLIRGSKERLAAFDSGEVDVMLLSLDYFANLVPVYQQKGVDLKAFLMADWSRGNLGIVTKPTITTVEGLKDAKVATTRNTATHYFLLSMLKSSNLKPADIEKVKSSIVFATKTPLAGEMWKRGEVDAVAIWEPHLSQALAENQGRLLVSTSTASNLIADVFFARADWLKAHEQEMTAFVKAWFEGVDLLAKDPAAGVEVVAKAFKQTPEETKKTLDKIKVTTFADNRVFFGLEREKAPYLTLFDDAARFWQKEGVIDKLPSAAAARWMGALEAVAREHANEKPSEKFEFGGGPKKDAAPLLTKSVSIYFATGADKLDPNAKKIVDDFAETLAQFGNAFVRVEGNTDNVGSRPKNVELSKRRAMALVDYLVAQHGFDRARFQPIGNGPDKPVGDNKTEEGRDMNRRTDFAIIPNH